MSSLVSCHISLNENIWPSQVTKPVVFRICLNLS